ncbi:MAG: hypothetical protein WAZ27_00835 [Minisyncoccia bacterium]
MLIDLEDTDLRPFELREQPYGLLRRVRYELGEIVASHLEMILCGSAGPRDIVLENFELKIIRDIAEDMDMESPV